MTWARPVGIGFCVVAVLFAIAFVDQLQSADTSVGLTILYAVLCLLAAAGGAVLLLAAERISGRRRY